MREMQLLAHLQMVAAAEADRRGRPLADPVHGEDDRLLEQRREESGRGVTLVVLREQELALPIEVGIEGAQLVAQELLLEQLLLQPERDRHAKGTEAPGGECKIGFEQPFELEERLVVERDMIDVGEADAGLGQAIGDGVMRETGIVLLAGEALLLGGGDDLSVDDQCRGTVVIERGQSENSHSPGSCGLEDRVDERRDRGALGEHDQAAEDDHHDEDRHQPIFLSDAQKRPEFAQKRQHGGTQNWFFIDSGAGPGGVRSIQ